MCQKENRMVKTMFIDWNHALISAKLIITGVCNSGVVTAALRPSSPLAKSKSQILTGVIWNTTTATVKKRGYTDSGAARINPQVLKTTT